jgi:phage terminase large subunit-like protein
MILIEQQGAGRPLIQMLAAENIHCWEYNPGRADKLQRLHMVSPLFVNGRVWCVESERLLGRPKMWAEETISQTCSYAGKGSLKHDDCLDACSQALRYFLDNFSGPLTVAKEEVKAGDVELVADHLAENPYSA